MSITTSEPGPVGFLGAPPEDPMLVGYDTPGWYYVDKDYCLQGPFVDLETATAEHESYVKRYL